MFTRQPPLMRSWLGFLIQFAAQVFPFFSISRNGAVRLVFALLIFGAPVALVFAWAFELTPEGIKRTNDVAPTESIRHDTGRKLTASLVILVAIASAVLAFQQLRLRSVLHDRSASPGEVSVPEKSIAVFPFENLSDEKGSSYFTDGVQDEVLTNLA